MKIRIKNIENSHEEQERDFLKTKDVAKMLNVSRPTLYRMIRENKLPHKKIGKKMYFYKPDIVKWFKEL